MAEIHHQVLFNVEYCETGKNQVHGEWEKKEVENVEKVHKPGRNNLK